MHDIVVLSTELKGAYSYTTSTYTVIEKYRKWLELIVLWSYMKSILIHDIVG